MEDGPDASVECQSSKPWTPGWLTGHFRLAKFKDSVEAGQLLLNPRSAIEAAEQENLQKQSERQWELRGEVGAGERPRNSLLGVDAAWDGSRGTEAKGRGPGARGPGAFLGLLLVVPVFLQPGQDFAMVHAQG